MFHQGEMMDLGGEVAACWSQLGALREKASLRALALAAPAEGATI
jgi:hypothetical protein